MPKSKKPSTVERKIYFYRIDCGNQENGSPIQFDCNSSLEHINTLPFQEDSRYLPDGEGNVYCAIIDDVKGSLRFAQVRRMGLPLQENGGLLSELGLHQDAGLFEATHILFLPNNIIGADFNFYGPRVSRFTQYLKARCANKLPNIFEVNPLLRRDAITQLDNLNDARLLHLRIKPSYASIIEEADEDLGAAFKAAQNVASSDEVEITLKVKKSNQSSVKDKIVSIGKNLISRNDLRTNAKNFSIRGINGQTGKVETIDLLKDQLISTKRIMKHGERSRALDPNSAYSAIQEAYSELAAELQTATSIASDV